MNKDLLSEIKIIIASVIVFCLFVFCLVTFFKLVNPLWVKMDAKSEDIAVESDLKRSQNSFVTISARKELLLKLAQDFDKLETLRIQAKSDPDLASSYKSQQISIINRMRLEASNLSESEVPAEVRHLIAR